MQSRRDKTMLAPSRISMHPAQHGVAPRQVPRRIIGEAPIIPTPSWLHPDQYPTSGTGATPDRMLSRVAVARSDPGVGDDTERAGWRILVTGAIPLLIAIGLLVLGVEPGPIVLAW